MTNIFSLFNTFAAGRLSGILIGMIFILVSVFDLGFARYVSTIPIVLANGDSSGFGQCLIKILDDVFDGLKSN